ncbi:hypothetical protein LJK87_00140 [Paenibacillus sp. P25]|nr:hypothetical protein LJK87_00140 [Paenibacillus sp. P25]
MPNNDEFQIPSGEDTITVSSTPVTLKSDKPYGRALITVENNDIRWWATGDNPTPTNGHLAKAGTSIELKNFYEVKNFKAVAVSASAVLQVSYYLTVVSTVITQLYGADINPPTTPTGLTATAVSGDQINLSWTASTDNVGVAGYDVYRNGVKIGSSATTSYSDTGLANFTTYSYTLKARDAAGNTSAMSDMAVAATTFDTTAPYPPTGVTAVPVSSTQINISWLPAWDNSGVAGYDVYRNGVKVGSSLGVAFSDTGLTAATSYSYTVKAKDAAGNLSVSSDSVSATTLPVSGGGPRPSTRYGAISDPQGRSLVGMRGLVNYSASAPGTEGVTFAQRTMHYIQKDCQQVQFMFQNVKQEANNANTIDLKLSLDIEDPVTKVVTTCQPIYWDTNNTQRTYTFAVGETKFTTPFNFNFTKGTRVWLNYYIACPAGGTMPKNGMKLVKADGDVAIPNGTDMTDTGGMSMASDYVGGAVMMPIAIVGKEIGGPTPSILLVGDSIQAGTGESANTPNARGFGVRMCYDMSFPYSNIAVGGETGANFVLNHNRRLEVAPFCTHVIDNYGTNDNGATLATMKATIKNIGNALKSANPNIYSYRMTIIPRGTSTTPYSNQTWYAPGGVKDQINAWMATAPYCEGTYDGYWDGGYELLEKPNVNGYIQSQFSSDTVHPLSVGHEMMKRAIDGYQIKNFQPFTKVENRIPQTPTGSVRKKSDTEVFQYWDASPATDFFIKGYNVYRDGVRLNNTLYAATGSKSVPWDKPMFYDSGLTTGQTYTYEIRAVSLWDVESPGLTFAITPQTQAIVASDSFNRPDGQALGNADVGVAGQTAWQILSGGATNWKINNPTGTDGQLMRVGGGVGPRVGLEVAVTDFDMTLIHTAQAAQTGLALGLRYTDLNNYFAVAWGYTASVSTYTSGVYKSNVINSAALNPAIAVGDVNTFRIVICGPMLIMWYKGNIVNIAYEPTLLKSGTKFTIAGGAATESYDNLVIRSIA